MKYVLVPLKYESILAWLSKSKFFTCVDLLHSQERKKVTSTSDFNPSSKIRSFEIEPVSFVLGIFKCPNFFWCIRQKPNLCLFISGITYLVRKCCIIKKIIIFASLFELIYRYYFLNVSLLSFLIYILCGVCVDCFLISFIGYIVFIQAR